MIITLNGETRDIKVKKENNVWIARVDRAIVYWGIGYDSPWVKIPGKTFEQVKKEKPVIVEFLKEYKRVLLELKKTPPLSFEGEERIVNSNSSTSNTKTDVNYVSGVPKWMTELKTWKVCSGKVRTYKRRVQIPQEHKELATQYISFCCNCVHRVECNAPCIHPESKSKETILEEIS